MAEIRRLFKYPNHLYLQELGWHNSFRIIQGAILKRYYIISISCQGIKYSILLGQLNSSVQAPFNQPVWSWPNWTIPYSTVGIPSHSSNFKMARTVFPDPDNTAIDPPSRINLSVFTYTGYLSSPGDFFPS
ncbi:hypothetical protein O181_097458 [Austropuccinia psidii MF-1]|uniref:Uncharacterized protein n=1 Tax=Austropuccinia psidii MF-1 TaxID=1389203 RepID=A0A9Q3J8Y4_9BASI|nr:hypothetical protein [Austropuccinia psidii MF-1]